MDKIRLLVATDFTPEADTALEHAVEVSKVLNAEIHLLNVIENEEQRKDAEEKLEAQEVKARNLASDLEIHLCAREGTIYEDIKEYAHENHIYLTFMGTHGVKGFQKFTGSRALKVLKESHVPFITIRGSKPKRNVFKNIIVPITMDVASKQKMKKTSVMAQLFGAEVHLIADGENDEDLGKQVRLNLKYAHNYLTERKIPFTSTRSNYTGGKFVKDIIKLSEEKSADLIIIMNMSETGLLNLVSSHFEQELIDNKSQIPVMLVNPADNRIYSGPASA